MSSILADRDALVAVLDHLDADLDELVGFRFDALTTPERLAMLERLERVRRRLPVPEHELINQLATHATPEDIGGRQALPRAGQPLADHPRGCQPAHRRGRRPGQRRTLTGQPLPPLLAATAAAQRAGKIGTGAVAVIRSFCHRLPDWIDAASREAAEADLARYATQFRPEQLAKLADKLTDCLNPDGDFTDVDRARRRGLTLGKQDIDGMSLLHGYLTPEARATLEAVWAKLAAPGMCNPADETPVVDGPPSEEAAQRDARSAAQRNHDALLAMSRALLAPPQAGGAPTGQLGQHNGLPAAIIVTTTLAVLEAKAGTALTGGGCGSVSGTKPTMTLGGIRCIAAARTRNAPSSPSCAPASR